MFRLPCPDEEDFLDQFGDERSGMTPDQVRALQRELAPLLLRRMKEDVETLPEKEEVGLRAWQRWQGWKLWFEVRLA